jgi:hypothetical protein
MRNNHFTKLADQLADDLREGKLSLAQYGLLAYLLQNSDKTTGELITNSRLLSEELHIKRKRIANLLYQLKLKARIKPVCKDKSLISQKQVSHKSDVSQKRGSQTAYPIYLPDHLPIRQSVAHKSDVSQRQVRGKSEASGKKSATTASTLDETANGTVIALNSDLDLDLDKDNIKWLVSLINKKCAVTWQPQTDGHRENLCRTLEFPRREIEAGYEKALYIKPGLKPPGVVAYVLTILDSAAAEAAQANQPYKTAQKEEVFKEKLERLEKEFEEAKPKHWKEFGREPDHKQFHMDKTWGMINITRLQLGLPTQEMPDYVGKEIENGSS